MIPNRNFKIEELIRFMEIKMKTYFLDSVIYIGYGANIKLVSKRICCNVRRVAIKLYRIYRNTKSKNCEK